MLSRQKLYRLLLLALLLAILALPVFAMAVDGPGLAMGAPYSTNVSAEETNEPVAIADNQCNGGSSGSCGGG